MKRTSTGIVAERIRPAVAASRRRPRLGAPVIAALVLLGASTTASAAVTSCTASADSFAFGSISLTSPSPMTGTVSIKCHTQFVAVTLTVSVKYCLSIGVGSGGAGAQLTPRWMKNATGEALQLDLSHDANHSQNVGSLATPATPPITGSLTYLSILGLIGSGSATHTLHARVPAQPMAAVGAYLSNFGGEHTELSYRYSDVLLAPAPSSCLAGGTGGASLVRAPFVATATVEPECQLNAATDLDFGDVPGMISSPVTASSSITMTCRRNTPWQLGLNDGLHADGPIRRMAGPNGSRVTYDIYRDAAMTQRFGQTENVDRLVGSGTGTSQTIPLYGRINGAQSVPAGTYADRVIVTVTY